MSCHGEREGCTDPNAINYDVLAELEDNSCTFPNVLMRFIPMITMPDDTLQLGFGQTYQINGLDVRLDQIRFYVDDVTLVTSAESFTSENTLLATESGKLGDLGELKIGDLQEVKFSVGVDPVDNLADPALQPANSPLSSDNPEIQHWNWTSGYKFFLIEGAVDVNGDGVFEQDMTEQMSIHCGFNDNLKNISLPIIEPTVVDRVGYELDIEYDVRGIFEGYDLTTQLFSRPNSNPEYATEIMNNVENIFKIR